MIRYFFTLLLLFTLFVLDAQDLIERTKLGISNFENTTSSTTNGLVRTLEEKKQSSSSRSTQSYHLFAVDLKRKSLPPNVTKGVSLNLQKEVFSEIRKQANTLINLSIPVNEFAAFDLDLYQVNIYAPGFKVTTSSPVDQVIKHSGIFYHGIIKGNPNSAVSLSIFEDMVDIFIQDSKGTYKLSKNIGGDYTLYYGHNTLKKDKLVCGSTGRKFQEVTTEQVSANSRSSVASEVPIYIEADYSLYIAKNRSINNTTQFIEMLMAEATVFYTRLDIPIKMSQLKIHTSPDGYADNGSIDGEKIADFGNAVKDNFPGIAAHLISGDAGGGIANIGVLCETYASQGAYGPYGVSGISRPNSQNPGLFDILTLAHELAHNFGSPHTQACFWNGNNTALDGCVAPETVGNQRRPTCSRPTPICPTGGGTIMSYCHIPDNCFFNDNWHPQVASYLQELYEWYSAAGCLDTNDTDNPFDVSDDGNDDDNSGTDNPFDFSGGGNDDDNSGICAAITGDLTTTDIDNRSAYVYIPLSSGFINNQFRYRSIDSDTWILTDISINFFRYLDRLLAGTTYEFQVRKICEDDISSEFTASTFFTTTGQAPSSESDSTTGTDDTDDNSDTNDTDDNSDTDDTDDNSDTNDTDDNSDTNDIDDNSDANDTDDNSDTNDTDDNSDTDNPTDVSGGEDDDLNAGTCAAITGNLTTSSIGDSNAYIYTPQPNGAINNQFRYRPIGSDTWMSTDISNTHYRYLSDLLAGTTYEYQVSQICEDGSYSEFSASASFTTTGQALGDGNNDTANTNTETNSQDITCIPVISDQLYVSNVSTSAAYVYTPQPSGITNNQFRYRAIGTANWEETNINTIYYQYLTGLSAGTTYEYEVRQECSTDIWSSYSDSYEFTTATNSQSSDLATPIAYTKFLQLSTSNEPVNITLSPNPVLNELVLRLDQISTASATLRIYNINGKLLKELSLPQGTSNATIEVNDLQSGLYLLEYRTASFSKTIKFIK